MPHGTVLLARQGDRALDRLGRYRSFNREVQLNAHETMRIHLSPVTDHMGAERPERMTIDYQRSGT